MSSTSRPSPLPNSSSHHAPAHPTRGRPSASQSAFEVSKAVGWAERHQRLLFAFVLGLAVVGVGIFIASQRQQRQLAADNHALGEAFAVLEAKVEAKNDSPAGAEKSSEPGADSDDDLQSPLAPDERLSFPTDASRKEAAFGAFSALAARLGDSSVGKLAGLMAANLEVDLERFDDAKVRLEHLSRQLAGDEGLYPLVLLRLAATQERLGDRQGALTTLAPLVNEQRLYLADEAGLMRARLFVAEGDKEAARAALQAARSRAPNSPLMDEIRVALAELGDSLDAEPRP